MLFSKLTDPAPAKADEWVLRYRGGEQVIERLIDGEKIKLDSHISRKSCTEISRVGTHRRARNGGAQLTHARTRQDPAASGLTPAVGIPVAEVFNFISDHV